MRHAKYIIIQLLTPAVLVLTPAGCTTPEAPSVPPAPVHEAPRPAKPAPKPEAKKPAAARHSFTPGKILLLIDIQTVDTLTVFSQRQKYIEDKNAYDRSKKRSDPPPALYPESPEVPKWSHFEQELNARRQAWAFSCQGNRELVTAEHFLFSQFDPYLNHIGIVRLADADTTGIRKMLGGGNEADPDSSVFFLTIVLQDLKEESETMQVGNTTVRRTDYNRKAVAKVRDCNGSPIFALNVESKATHRRTSATQNRGRDPASDITEDLLRQIAERVAGEFLCKLTIKVTGPKNDADFDAETVVFYLDGREFENGGTVLAGPHRLLAQCEGYRDIARPIKIKGGKNRTISIKFTRKGPDPAKKK